MDRTFVIGLIAWAVLCIGGFKADAGPQTDTDGDGLCNYQEIHKYLTDPALPDSDGDGHPDSDWDERQEYTYTVRSVLRYMHPWDQAALNDNFQDAKVLANESYYTDLEVIHYPLATAEDTISANVSWQSDYVGMSELQPSITINWDAAMRLALIAELESSGIYIDTLTDKQVIEQVSAWVVSNYAAINAFTTYYVNYPGGQPAIYPGLEAAFDRDNGDYGWTVQEQFEHELLGKGMYYNKTRGTCTSSANALAAALRAVGIPTRMIIVIPLVDSSNPAQRQLVEQGIVNNNNVRQTVLNWIDSSVAGFTAHTMNEVYVGNEWHRLNYNELGQPVLDEFYFGLQTHIYSFDDLNEPNLAPTWGWRYGKSITSDVFGYYNPYTTLSISDLVGEHVVAPAGPVLYVDDDGSFDPGPGDPTNSDPCENGSLLHPYDSIQQAINAAEDGYVIIVKPGTYTGPGNRDINYKALALTIRSSDPNDPDVVAATIIDSQGNAGNPHRGFYFQENEESDSILDGFTITGGYVTGSWPESYGGGIICYYADPTIKNCVVTGNTAVNHGGGIYCYTSSAKFINCKCVNNSAAWNGGGMHNGPANPTLINCAFVNNSASSNGGGASFTSGSNGTLINCTFSGNTASNGGAINSYEGNLTLTNCILWGNSPDELNITGTMLVINYSDIQGGYPNGSGNINTDPLFVDQAGGDIHLKSRFGHWSPSSHTWLLDVVTSPCVDTADPTSNWTSELWPHGGRANMGAYGDTAQASMSPNSMVGNVADLNYDGRVNLHDFSRFSKRWLLGKHLLAEDMNRDSMVDMDDMASLALNWLWGD